VAYGVAGLKNHAKVALIERRNGLVLQRFVHIGTGNYNPQTARLYTDLSVFTATNAIGRDVRAVFDALMTGEAPAAELLGTCLAAPHGLRIAMLERIQREIGHARRGCAARIRLKLNGLADSEMVEALYEASRAGVDVDLVIRAICTLRPGVPGLSERIRVVSAVGRFLEHSRICEFANGGETELLIGSADWRPRNLRRRVELMVPVVDPNCRARLQALLDLELSDPTAWDLTADGVYSQRSAPAMTTGTQARLRADAMGAAGV
jgi:polyphosphate kinase